MYRILTLSEEFIQWKDLHVRIGTPTARNAGYFSDKHVRAFLLNQHVGQGRYPTYTPNSNIDSTCI